MIGLHDELRALEPSMVGSLTMMFVHTVIQRHVSMEMAQETAILIGPCYDRKILSNKNYQSFSEVISSKITSENDWMQVARSVAI